MSIFNRRKKSLEVIQIEEGIAYRSDEYFRMLPLLRESEMWLTKVLNRQAHVRDSAKIEELLSEIRKTLAESVSHTQDHAETRKAK